MAQNSASLYEKARPYFANLTRAQIQGLFDANRIDAELFGYEVEPFLAMAKEP